MTADCLDTSISSDVHMRHKHEIQEIQNAIQSAIASSKHTPLSFVYKKGNSNVTRKKTYNSTLHKIQMPSLDKVLHIDVEQKLAYVQPRVSMDTLVRETLKYNLIPCVVPEFKGITVGGAINGEAGESSSFIYGTFHDTCLAHEVILGDGSCITATRNVHQDLFYALAGSYGTLGIITSSTVRLTQAKPWVECSYFRFTDTEKAIHFIKNVIRESSYDFIDGLILSSELFVVICGKMCSDNELSPTSQKIDFKKASSRWYLHEVITISTSTIEVPQHAIPIYDYIFRYDLGAFWMGGYVLNPYLLSKFILEGLCGFESVHKEHLTESEINSMRLISQPGYVLRRISHQLMGSIPLYGLLHKAESWVEKRTIIQDFCMPEDNVSCFIEKAKVLTGIYPLWICPIKKTTQEQLFSPHRKNETDTNDFVINVGIYGLPNKAEKTSTLTKSLENLAYQLKGRKVLYSHSYYNSDEFWNIYPKDMYNKLRDTYHATHTFRSIDEKVLKKA